ncbi:hypothetical protein HRI_005190300 [Hibiscus trionum]|uniref:Uncharacterized protein n=1 Tax=Hibiscus trionum TaxID=183268 RepID=A0A9W7JIM6_HIBTR|nr:hypothetical protein HRI_005190300 [Hibiscus trionum]
MAKRKCLNIVSTIRNSESRAQSEEQRATSAQHQEQSQAQQSQQSEEVQGVVGQQSREEQSQPSSEDINHKKVRGATLMPDIWELPEGQRVNVKINNLYQPVGEESTCLCRFIGTMVRKAEFAPISYLNWHEMPNNKKEEMWSTIELKFQFQLFDSEEGVDEATLKHVKKWVLSDMNTKWRQWKNELKSQIFDENQTVEQIVENCKDPRVNLDQLKTLVEYWLSSKAMEQSATNRSNRSKLSEPHCTGTRSFPRIVEDLTAESNGIPPTRADVYVRSRTRKDGSIVNSRAAVVVERIQEKRNESMSSENLSQTSWSNDVFAQVKGPERRGRVRCVGAVHTRSSQESGPSQSVQNTEEVEGLKSKVAKLEKLFETCFLPYFQQQRPDLHVPDMDALLRMVDTEATPDAGSASAPVNCISPSLPSTNQQNRSGNDAGRQ